MKAGQTGDLMYHGTGILLTMVHTGTLLVSSCKFPRGFLGPLKALPFKQQNDNYCHYCLTQHSSPWIGME